MTRERIEKALVSGVGTHQGVPLAGLDAAELAELIGLGYAGRSGGLTRKGSILAGRVQARLIEEAFA